MSTSLKRKNKPLLIGLTGGIGSGKSTVAKIFENLGVPIFNSDVEAKKIINSDVEVVKQITEEFGGLYENGKLNNQKMAELAFNDKRALEKLNNIIHPKVKESFKNWVAKNATAAILMKEAAILIEIGAYEELDKIILVTAPEKLRIQRVISRDNTSEEKVLERMQVQLSDKEKLNYADFTIVNDEKQMVIPQVLKLFKQIKRLNG